MGRKKQAKYFSIVKALTLVALLLPAAITISFLMPGEIGAQQAQDAEELPQFGSGEHLLDFETNDLIYQWHTFYGSTGSDASSSIAVAEDGSIYMTGSSGDSWNGPGGAEPLNVHSGGSDIVIVKLNNAGAYQWHTFYGSSGNDGGSSIAVAENGSVYVTGNSQDTWNGPDGTEPVQAHAGGELTFFDRNIVIMKLNSSGEYQWHTFYGSSYSAEMIFGDSGRGIAISEDGSIYVTGSSPATWEGPDATAPLNTHAGLTDIVIVKLNDSGEYQWHTFHGGTSRDYGSDIAVAEDGSVYATGGSPTTWKGPGDVEPLNHHASDGDMDFVIVKLNSAGTYQWHTFYGASDYDHGSGIAVAEDGSVYVTGTSGDTWVGPDGELPLNNPHSEVSTYDIATIKLNSAGKYQWHTFYGSSVIYVGKAFSDMGYDIAVDSAGSVYVTGYSQDTWEGTGGTAPLNAHSGDGIWDSTIFKLDSAGEYQWHTFYGGMSTDIGDGIAVDAAGSVYVTGTSAETWAGPGGTAPLNAFNGNRNMFIVKQEVSQPPIPPPTTKLGDISGDGEVDVEDVVLAMRFSLALETPTDEQKAAADVNGDGKIDVTDVVLIMRYALEIIDTFPAE